LPENYSVPPANPAEPPDLGSPGFWCTVFKDGKFKLAYIQIAVNTSPDHEAKPPEKGLPGEWISVYSSDPPDSALAWIPSEEEETEKKKEK